MNFPSFFGPKHDSFCPDSEIVFTLFARLLRVSLLLCTLITKEAFAPAVVYTDNLWWKLFIFNLIRLKKKKMFAVTKVENLPLKYGPSRNFSFRLLLLQNSRSKWRSCFSPYFINIAAQANHLFLFGFFFFFSVVEIRAKAI